MQQCTKAFININLLRSSLESILTNISSNIQKFVCRYAGMVAWRGVVDGNTHPELLAELKADLTTLGNGIIFDIANRCMNLIYMIPGNRINWLW